MEAEKLERISDYVYKILISSVNFLGSVISLGLTIFIAFGALASLILLSKLYPEIYLTIKEPMYIVFNFLYMLIKAVLVIILIILTSYVVSFVSIMFTEQSERIKNKRELARKKFIKELKKELNKK